MPGAEDTGVKNKTGTESVPSGEDRYQPASSNHEHKSDLKGRNVVLLDQVTKQHDYFGAIRAGFTEEVWC